MAGRCVCVGHKYTVAHRRSYKTPAFVLFAMSDGDDSAALWKVNRTIHELVKDRVPQDLFLIFVSTSG
jgi:hypothetical protein